jgi:3-hydroxyacyl-CoA dehydrogenase
MIVDDTVRLSQWTSRDGRQENERWMAMRRQIRKVAVLGSGVMGSGIAAHFANAGIPSLVLDIVPRELTKKEEAAGLTLDNPRVRNRIAAESVAALKKTRPSPIYSTEMMSLIEVGNFEDDLAKLKDVDWIIEVVKEDMAIKKIVLGNVAPHVGPETIFTSNTSGLSLAEMSAVLPEEMRPRFLGTHFFNPPRYMKLFEVIPTADTDPELL